MAITAFIYGCIGLTFGSVLIYYIMISGEYKSWPMNIGGKNFIPLPAFIPITFECTILFASLGMVGTFLVRRAL